MFISLNAGILSCIKRNSANSTSPGRSAWYPSSDELCFSLWLFWTLSSAPFRAVSKHN